MKDALFLVSSPRWPGLFGQDGVPEEQKAETECCERVVCFSSVSPQKAKDAAWQLTQWTPLTLRDAALFPTDWDRRVSAAVAAPVSTQITFKDYHDGPDQLRQELEKKYSHFVFMSKVKEGCVQCL